MVLMEMTTVAEAGPSKQSVVVDKALSGDTVQLKGGKILKYIGVEAYRLESKVDLARDYAQKALNFNAALVNAKKITVEWDNRIRDDQNRLLGYVFLEDGRFVNQELLAAGQAKSRVVAPNRRYAALLRAAEDAAKKEKRGLWLKEPKSPYGDKRFIGEKSTKIYYLPRSPELERIPEAQLIYFNSRVDAVAAGFHSCHECRAESPDAWE